MTHTSTRFARVILALCISIVGAFAQTIATGDVVRMAEAGLSEEVILLSIGQAQQVSTPSVDEIIGLKKAGVTDRVIATMLNGSNSNTGSTLATPTPEEPSEKSDTDKGIVGTTVGSVTSGAKKIGGIITSPFSKGNKNREDNLVKGRKVFISAQPKVVNGIEFPDAELEDSVQDLQAAAEGKGFTVVGDEDSADLKLLLLRREMREVPAKFWKHKTRRIDNTLDAALFEKENNTWQPVATLTGSSNNWRSAAAAILKQVKEQLEASKLITSR